MQRYRQSVISASEAATELVLSKARFYKLYKQYLRAVGKGQANSWCPGTSGGNHHKAWPDNVRTLIAKLLKAKPPCSYSFIASELLRRFEFKTDRANVRRFALQQGWGPQKLPPKPKPVRRWQTQQVGQLWQYDASPHRWLPDQNWQPSLLQLIDDHSRCIPGARLYERETLLAHLEFISNTFQSVGLPLCLYVDYHSFFFTHTPEAHTQLAGTLHFYDVSLRFAPTPQAKGKIERAHSFWQKRLPSLFQAEQINTLPQANALLEDLRRHHNQMEHHREIGSTPQVAWDLAKKENRSVLRPPPRCPWWPYVFSQRSLAKIDSDGKVAVGSQRLRVECASGTKIVRCLHPNGDITFLKEPPDKNKSPTILLSTRLC